MLFTYDHEDRELKLSIDACRDFAKSPKSKSIKTNQTSCINHHQSNKFHTISFFLLLTYMNKFDFQ